MSTAAGRSADVARATRRSASEAAVPCVVVLHGTRDEAGRAEQRALLDAVRAGVAGRVRGGVIEYPSPGLPPVFDALAETAETARRGAGTARIVPALLLPARHASADLRVVVRGARRLHPDVRWTCAPLLRPEPPLLAALGHRVHAAEAAAAVRADALLVVARGSSAPRAAAWLHRSVCAGLEALDGREVRAAFCSLAAPSIPDALGALAGAGAERITVVPYLLCSGHFTAVCARQAAAFAARHPGVAVTVTEHLGLHPAVIALLRSRCRGERRHRPALSFPPRRRLPRPIVVAGTASGVGKTTVALGLMAALRGRGLRVQPFKVGPDYIDPLHHGAVAGRMSRNLDSVLCDPRALGALADRAMAGADVAVVEGVLGLHDGRLGAGDRGSTAEVARILDAAVVLVVDAAHASRSAGAVALGHARFDPRVRIAGVILNRVGSERHAAAARDAVEREAGLPVLGVLPVDAGVTIPERYLGLLPPQERSTSAAWVERVAGLVERGVDVGALLGLASAGARPLTDGRLDPFATPTRAVRARIAVARDDAFSFHYEDALDLLAHLGGELVPFSPLADERLPRCGAVWFGGGFPERFASALSANRSMRASVAAAIRSGVAAVGECGGAMYLGRHVVDAGGDTHPMCGVLPWGTRMGARRRALGYRTATALVDSPLLRAGGVVTGHEFHWSSVDPGLDAARAAWRFAETGERDGHATGGLLASYLHVHLCGAPAAAARLVAAAERAERAGCGSALAEQGERAAGAAAS